MGSRPAGLAEQTVLARLPSGDNEMNLISLFPLFKRQALMATSVSKPW